MCSINVQRWFTVGQSLENVMWKKNVENLIIAKYVIISINLHILYVKRLLLIAFAMTLYNKQRRRDIGLS